MPCSLVHPFATSWPSSPRESMSLDSQVAIAPLRIQFLCHPKGDARAFREYLPTGQVILSRRRRISVSADRASSAGNYRSAESSWSNRQQTDAAGDFSTPLPTVEMTKEQGSCIPEWVQPCRKPSSPIPSIVYLPPSNPPNYDHQSKNTCFIFPNCI